MALDDQFLTLALILPDGRVVARNDRRPGSAPRDLPVDRAAVRDGRRWYAFSGEILYMTQPVMFDGRLLGVCVR